MLSLALDISSATGKPLEAIANSLGKAYDGNTNALGKLGLGIDQSILKTKDFNKVYESLRTSFAGFSEQEANTFQGRLDRLNVAFDEAKETVGFALLPVLEKLIRFVNDNALPVIKALSEGFSLTGSDGFGKVVTDVANTLQKTFTPILEGVKSVFDSVKTAVMNSKEEFSAFWEVVKFVAPIIGTVIGKALSVVGNIAETILTIVAKVMGALKPLINTAIDGINLAIKGYNAIQWGKDVPQIPKIGSTATVGVGGFSGTMPNGVSFSSGGTTTGSTGLTSGGTTTVSSGSGGGIAGAVVAAASAANNIVSGNFNPGSFRMGEAASMGTIINLNVNGALDKEGTARTIVDTLNNSYYRGTGGATNLLTL